MPPIRKVRAADLARKNADAYLLRYLVLLILVGGFFLFYMFRWNSDEEFDRFKRAREYSEYYKEFFVEAPLNYKVFGEMTLVIRATNLGSEFWNKEFYGMIRQSENEVNEILDVAKLINAVHGSDNGAGKEEQNLSSFPDLYEVLKTGKDLSAKTLYNPATGEIFEFWERELRNYKRKVTAYSKAETIAGYLFDNPSLAPVEIQNRKKLLENLTKEKAQAVISTDDILKKIGTYADENFEKLIKNALSRPSPLTDAEKNALLINILKHVQMHAETAVSPKMDNLRQFIPFAKAEHINLDDAKKSVKITNPNASISMNFFREALFLKKLKEKLPKENFNYLIFVGDRHGVWKLPKEFIRWSVSIDDPYAVTDKARGAIKLMAEEGFFVVTRKNEELLFSHLDDLTKKIRKDLQNIEGKEQKNEYIGTLRKEHPSRKYFFDPIKISIFKRYDTPVDWRTGLPVEKNLSAIVLDEDPVKARMLSYSLFISDTSEVQEFEKNFPETVFSILKSDDSVYISEQWKSIFMTTEDIKKARIQFEYRSRGLNPDGSVPKKK